MFILEDQKTSSSAVLRDNSRSTGLWQNILITGVMLLRCCVKIFFLRIILCCVLHFIVHQAFSIDSMKNVVLNVQSHDIRRATYIICCSLKTTIILIHRQRLFDHTVYLMAAIGSLVPLLHNGDVM